MGRSVASVASVASVGAVLLFAVPALGFGPNAKTSSPAVTACAGPEGEYTSGVVVSQAEGEVQAGGGPKSIAPAPTNCDHFWQTPESESGAGVIGNGWPPPPFASP
jgi:hypothetical protein